MTIAITGGHGFLGWHTAARLHTLHGDDALRLGRSEMADTARLARLLTHTSTVIHIAGVNRADSENRVEEGNVEAATSLASALRATGTAVHIVYANSIQSGNDSGYGRGKRRAGDVLRTVARDLNGTFAEVRLPNLFGEYGRAGYNSFIATFCADLAAGKAPEVLVDRMVPLMHAQAAADVLLTAARAPTDELLKPKGIERRVTEVLATLERFNAAYTQGQIPLLQDDFEVDLFNTFRSYFFPQAFPFRAVVHADPRGELFETVRVLGSTGQTFVSTTRPRMSRGDHYHLRKIERFFVIAGEAEIALRRVLSHEVIRFRLSGGEPAFVDMPTMWTHKITNVGETDLITQFWADQLHNPEAPDTYWENVIPARGGSA